MRFQRPLYRHARRKESDKVNTIIKDIHARALIDCKGKPLLEVNVITEDGIMGCGASPSGISA